jgi:hypothetical protein
MPSPYLTPLVAAEFTRMSIRRGIYRRSLPMFRLSQGDDGSVVDVTTFEQLVLTLQAGERGRFRIEEITRDPLPPGQKSSRWGVGAKWADGTIVIERDPSPPELLGPGRHA